MLLVSRQTRQPAVVLHKSVQALSADRKIPSTWKEQGRVILAGIKVGFKYPHLVRLHRVLTAVAALQPVAIDSELLKINVGFVKPADLGSSETVPISENEKGAVALVAARLNGIEQAFEFVEGQKLDRLLSAEWHGVQFIRVLFLVMTAFLPHVYFGSREGRAWLLSA